MNLFMKNFTHKSSGYLCKKNHRIKKWNKIVIVALSIILLSENMGTTLTVTATERVEATSVDTQKRVVDIDTKNLYVDLMANELYPNATTSRYSGRIWADKSVFADTSTIIDGKSFSNDSDFLIAGSFLGSTRAVHRNQKTPIDLMVILDSSESMAVTGTNPNLITNQRMPNAVKALNTLFNAVKEHSTDSRISLVRYSSSVDLILPLKSYTWEGDCLSTQKKGNSYEVSINCNESTANFSTGGGTYTQGGLYEGMQTLANSTDTKVTDSTGNLIVRQPVVIVITDGQPQRFTANNWWEPLASIDNSNGTGNGRAACALATIMTGAYWKQQITQHYGITPFIYTIGIDIENTQASPTLTSYVEAVLNPDKGFRAVDGIDGTDIPDTSKPNFQQSVGYAYNAWEKYSKGEEFSLPDSKAVKQSFNHPDNDITTVSYVDKYYPTVSDELGGIFEDIIENLESEAFHPTDESTGGQQSAMIYRDPIGKYMEVKDVKGVLWDGTLYNAVKNQNGTYTLTLAEGETTPKHPITGKEIDINQMTIKVEHTITDGKTTETFVVEIPNECLPLRYDEITVKDGVMIDYTSSRYTTTPLRVLYTVGIQDSIKTDGKIDIEKVDEAYKTANSNTDGSVNFYSNLYVKANNPTGDDRYDNGAIGDTTVQFTPSIHNRYYFFQKNRQIYFDESCVKPVPADYVTDNHLPDGSYYFKIDYYVSDDTSHGYDGSHSGYTETVVERSAEQLAGAVDTIDGKVYTKIGASRMGRLDFFSRQKINNKTETASYSFVPHIENDTYEMTIFLGNNGRLTTAVPTANDTGALTVSKIVTGNAGDKNKDFNFAVTLSDKTISGVYGDLKFTDGVATFTLKNGESKTATNLPAGIDYEVTETEENQDGYVTSKKDDTGTITKDVTGTAVFTNAKDVTPPEPDTGNLTVSKIVTGNAGDKNKDFNFTVTLSDKTISGVYGDLKFTDGVATFTLKNGESKTATNLPAGIDYEVTETEENQDGYVTS
ncbi:DUF7601 domain-containing protein, partial [Clostridioides difficile]